MKTEEEKKAARNAKRREKMKRRKIKNKILEEEKLEEKMKDPDYAAAHNRIQNLIKKREYKRAGTTGNIITGNIYTPTGLVPVDYDSDYEDDDTADSLAMTMEERNATEAKRLFDSFSGTPPELSLNRKSLRPKPTPKEKYWWAKTNIQPHKPSDSVFFPKTKIGGKRRNRTRKSK